MTLGRDALPFTLLRFDQNEKMAIQWHPLLAQFLRHSLSDQIQIQDSISLGQMPLEMDLLFQPSVPIQSLPYPYNYLGQFTIGEFKGAGDTANWATVAQIESYACLYQMQQKIVDRNQITLWVIASKFAGSFPLYVDDLTPIGPGVQRGTLAHFPIYQIDLATLPITPATLSLLMVYKGTLAREREIVRSLVEHYHELGEMRNFISILHPQAIKEVLAEMNLESLRGFDLDLPAILELFPPEQVIENIGLEKTIEIIGLEKTIETIGWEKIIQNLDASALNEQERELLIEQLRQLNENDN